MEKLAISLAIKGAAKFLGVSLNMLGNQGHCKRFPNHENSLAAIICSDRKIWKDYL